MQKDVQRSMQVVRSCKKVSVFCQQRFYDFFTNEFEIVNKQHEIQAHIVCASTSFVPFIRERNAKRISAQVRDAEAAGSNPVASTKCFILEGFENSKLSFFLQKVVTSGYNMQNK